MGKFLLTSDCVARVFVSDWVNYEKYGNKNLECLSRKNDQPTLVLFGDSITENWARFLPDLGSGVEILNRGIGGQTSFQALLRFRSDVVALDPGYVVILIGTNDVAGNSGDVSITLIQQNVMSMVEIAKANDIEPVLCSILPVDKYYWREDVRPIGNIPMLNTWLADYSKRCGLVFVDYYPHFVDQDGGMKDEFSGDGVHLNEQGYFILNEVLLRNLNGLLGCKIDKKF